MRLVLFVLAVSVFFAGVSAAGAKSSAAGSVKGKPLFIGDRVLHAGELPGFAPNDTPKVVASVAAWNKVAPSGGIDLEARLRASGFVSAVREPEVEGWRRPRRSLGRRSARIGQERPGRDRTRASGRRRRAEPRQGHGVQDVRRPRDPGRARIQPARLRSRWHQHHLFRRPVHLLDRRRMGEPGKGPANPVRTDRRRQDTVQARSRQTSAILTTIDYETAAGRPNAGNRPTVYANAPNGIRTRAATLKGW